jgi:hypothetical protein
VATRGLGREVVLEGLAACLHPVLGDGPELGFAGSEGVELIGEDVLAAGSLQVGVDQVDDGLDRGVLVRRGGEALFEDVADARREAREGR